MNKFILALALALTTVCAMTSCTTGPNNDHYTAKLIGSHAKVKVVDVFSGDYIPGDTVTIVQTATDRDNDIPQFHIAVVATTDSVFQYKNYKRRYYRAIIASRSTDNQGVKN